MKSNAMVRNLQHRTQELLDECKETQTIIRARLLDFLNAGAVLDADTLGEMSRLVTELSMMAAMISSLEDQLEMLVTIGLVDKT